MNEAEIKAMVQDVLTQVAPNIDTASLDPETAFRDQVEFDSLDFLNFVIALGERSGSEIPEIDYPKLASLQGCIGYFTARSKAVVD
ncbi:MAG: phosphopantetheine-binding protein [Kiloniellales bacterium]|nr:phosphopantetheine-binding protein [Kiloniellales bacterium]